MNKEELCKDIYGKELNIGDTVIAIVSDDIIKEGEGIITDIEFRGNLSYLTLIDEDGNVIDENVLSTYYTTKERYNEFENSDITLWINFHSNKGYIDSKIPLNSSVSTDFNIPKNTVGISISYDKYEYYEDGSYDTASEELYYFALDKDVDVTKDDDIDVYIIKVKETGRKDWISKNADVKLFSSLKELKTSLKETIEFLKTKDLDKCNRKIPYEENEELQNIKAPLTKH